MNGAMKCDGCGAVVAAMTGRDQSDRAAIDGILWCTERCPVTGRREPLTLAWGETVSGCETGDARSVTVIEAANHGDLGTLPN